MIFYFSVPEEEIKGIESVMTIVDGKVVYAAGHFTPLAPPAIPVVPDWSPVVKVPGHYRSAPPAAAKIGAMVQMHQVTCLAFSTSASSKCKYINAASCRVIDLC